MKWELQGIRQENVRSSLEILCTHTRYCATGIPLMPQTGMLLVCTVLCHRMSWSEFRIISLIIPHLVVETKCLQGFSISKQKA